MKIRVVSALLVITWQLMLSAHLNAQTIAPEDTAPIDVGGTSQCASTSIICWPKVHLVGGILNCGTYQTKVDKFAFQDEATFKTYFCDLNNCDPGVVGHIRTSCEEQWYLGCDGGDTLNGNIHVENGKVTIRGKYTPQAIYSEQVHNPNFPAEPNEFITETYARDFTSGMFQTKDLFKTHFGNFEIKIDDMPGGGWWPSFWMWHHEEVEVFERFYSNHKYLYNSYPSGTCKLSQAFDINEAQDSVKYSDGFDTLTPYNNGPNSLFGGPHTFRMEWTPFTMTWYYKYGANGTEITLPNPVYKFYRLNGTPLIINCGDQIPEGDYYENPNFIKAWRDSELFSASPKTEPTQFAPQLGIGVLPRYGLGCCGPNNPRVKCNRPNFVCTDWGNPILPNANSQEDDTQLRDHAQRNTQTVVDYVKIQNRTYQSDAISVKYNKEICLGKNLEVDVENFNDNLSDAGNQNHIVNVYTIPSWITTSGNLKFIDKSQHRLRFKTLSAGPAWFTFKYGNPVKIFRDSLVIKDDGSCATVPCQPKDSTGMQGCCPPNSGFDGRNCLLKLIPPGYKITLNANNGIFYVAPHHVDATTDVHGCPPGYAYDPILGCNTGIQVPFGYQGFWLDNKLYVRPNCNDVRDCCPPGFIYENGSCNSGLKFDGYTPFIINNAFYVQKNCIEQNYGNDCCPAGFTFDGKNCFSGLIYANGSVVDGKYIVPLHCDDPNDCCPVGTQVNLSDRSCGFFKIPEGFSVVNFTSGNRLYVRPNCAAPNHDNLCCPQGFNFDVTQGTCYKDITSPIGPANLFLSNGAVSFHIDCTTIGLKTVEIRTDEKSEKPTTDAPVISAYPNPAENLLNVVFNQAIPDESTLRVFDAFGIEKQEFQLDKVVPKLEMHLNLTDYPAGVYFLLLETDNSKSMVRFIKI
jgi:hypothetical protein